MRRVILVGLMCAVAALSSCKMFTKTATPTPDRTALAETPTSTLPSPIAARQLTVLASTPVAGNATAAAAKLTFITVAGAKVGAAANVSVQAEPNAQCALSFTSPPGSASVGTALETKTADPAGHVSWTWNIALGTVSGAGAVTVKCGGTVATAPITID